MFQRGDLVPHFEVRTLHGERFSYSTIWQRRNLVLVTLPAAESDSARTYTSRLTARAPAFSARDADCVITRDNIPGLPAPGVLVADRWGEIIHVAAASAVDDLPPAEDLLDWTRYVQTQCPECEGEAK